MPTAENPNATGPAQVYDPLPGRLAGNAGNLVGQLLEQNARLELRAEELAAHLQHVLARAEALEQEVGRLSGALDDANQELDRLGEELAAEQQRARKRARRAAGSADDDTPAGVEVVPDDTAALSEALDDDVRRGYHRDEAPEWLADDEADAWAAAMTTGDTATAERLAAEAADRAPKAVEVG